MMDALRNCFMALAALFGSGAGRGGRPDAERGRRSSGAENAEIEAVREILRRKAVLLETGEEPTSDPLESWIGGVRWKGGGESPPRDAAGREMIPLASIFLEGLPCLPPALSGLKHLAVFMAADIWDHLGEDDMGPWFAIRAYASLEGLVPCDWRSAHLTPRPLRPRLVEDDYPDWDGGLPEGIEARLHSLEQAGLDYYDTVREATYEQHKIGGYPTFCQSGRRFGDGYIFVMQIVSDDKAGLNIVDGGHFYFCYHPQKKDWKAFCDFY